jgi:transcriptional regulator with XRE-family HTH domain
MEAYLGGAVATKSPLPTDVLVGQNIRIGRLQAGLSQTELGARVGVTFQQIQKYEKGANRIDASRLQQIADALRVPIPALFDGARTAHLVPTICSRYLGQAASPPPAAGLRQDQ